MKYNTSPPPQPNHPTNTLILRYLKRNQDGATITQIHAGALPRMSESGIRDALHRMRDNWGFVEQITTGVDKQRVWKFVKGLQAEPSSDSQQIVHGEGCWSWGPAHYECACAEIAKLRGWVG